MSASQVGQVITIQKLIELGADIDTFDDNYNCPALYFAILSEILPAVEALLETSKGLQSCFQKLALGCEYESPTKK